MKEPRFGKKEVQSIFDKHHLGIVNSIFIKSKNAINSSLLINSQYILKVNHRDPSSLTLRREELALTVLGKTDIPVPEIIVLDESTDVFPYPYIITLKMEGRVLEDGWRRMIPDNRKRLSYEAGVLLAQIHNVSFPLFGDINERTFGELGSWDCYMLKETRLAVGECEKLCLLNEAEGEQVLNLYEKNKELFAEVGGPSLVHNDFHIGNLLYVERRIAGVLDFEFAIAGDPEFDLKQMYNVFSWYPECEIPFLEGYCSTQSLSDDFRTKLPFYRLLLCIQLAPVAKRYWKKRIQQRIAKEMLLLLRTMKTSNLHGGRGFSDTWQ